MKLRKSLCEALSVKDPTELDTSASISRRCRPSDDRLPKKTTIYGWFDMNSQLVGPPLSLYCQLVRVAEILATTVDHAMCV